MGAVRNYVSTSLSPANSRRIHHHAWLPDFFINALVILAIFYAPSSEAFTGGVERPPTEKIWQSDSVKRIEKDGVTFEIDKNARILLNLPKLKRLKLEYSADGYFKLEYVSHKKGFPLLSYNPFLRGFALRKGEGELVIDLRHTENWGIDSLPVLFIRGNGKLKIKKLVTETISPDDGPVAYQKDTAFFWMPERYTHTSVNSITPVFWSYSDKIFFTSVLAVLYGIALALLYLLSTRKKSIAFSKLLPAVSALFAFIFMTHFGLRFYPTLHAGLFLSPEEKRESYYIEPELGPVINAARKHLTTANRVIVIGRDDDWFAKESICFHISDRECGFLKSEEIYLGLSYVDKVTWETADAVVSYNSREEPDFDYRKVWELNDNVFIGTKR